MTLLATLRQQQRTRARTVLGLLVVVWLNLTLQACATTVPATELTVDRPTETEMLDASRPHAEHDPDAHCAHCLACEHVRCAEQRSCEAPVVASTSAETRLPESTKFESTVAATSVELDFAATYPNACPVRPMHQSVSAAVAITIEYCVYLI